MICISTDCKDVSISYHIGHLDIHRTITVNNDGTREGERRDKPENIRESL